MSDNNLPTGATGANQQAADANQQAVDSSQRAADSSQRAADSSQQDEERRELIFKSDLNQVYLLLSFISGRPERNLYALTMQNPDNPGMQWGHGKIVEEVMNIR